MYTTMYLSAVQEAFNFIVILPDKVLRWISGTQETLGADSLKWGQEPQKQMQGGGEKTLGAAMKGGEEAQDKLEKKFSGGKQGQGSVGGSSTPGAGGVDMVP